MSDFSSDKHRTRHSQEENEPSGAFVSKLNWIVQRGKSIVNRLGKQFENGSSTDRNSETAMMRQNHNYKEDTSCWLGPGQCGLANLGNTCYMNSALQCLSSTTPLREYFIGDYQYPHKHNELLTSSERGASSHVPLVKTFSALLEKMWSEESSKQSLIPADLKHIQRAVGCFARRFCSFSQHDSQEFLTYLLEGLHKDLKEPLLTRDNMQDEYKNSADASGGLNMDQEHVRGTPDNHVQSDDSVITNLFQGQLQTCLICGNSECGEVIETLDPFMFLALPLPNLTIHLPRSMQGYQEEAIYPEKTCTLRDCLELMTKETSTTKPNWFCDSCNTSVELNRKVTIDLAPEILVIYFKRFHASRSGKYKLCTHISFPEELDLSPFLCKSNTQSHYDLYALIDHHGSITGGHYTATARHADKWYLFNDNIVTPQKVLNSCRTVYVLFYKKKHANEGTSVDASIASDSCGHSESKTGSNDLACDTNKVTSAADVQINPVGWDCGTDTDSDGSVTNWAKIVHDGSSTSLDSDTSYRIPGNFTTPQDDAIRV